MSKKLDAKKALIARNIPVYEKPKPTIYVEENDLPEMKSWELGKKYKVLCEVEMIGIEKRPDYAYTEEGEEKKKDKIEGRFKVISIRPTK